jgi:hypothetical protein
MEVPTVTSILADLPCPSWCTGDVPTDAGGVIHLSDGKPVSTGGALAGFISVSLERSDAEHLAGSPTIRIESSSDEMTPLQAFELAATLQAVAVAALVEAAVA